MRTTVDISEPLLRRAKSKAALEGKKLNDIVNEALVDMLEAASLFDDLKPNLPSNTRIDDIGKFRIPVLRSPRPGRKSVSAKRLKEIELNEDASRYGKSD